MLILVGSGISFDLTLSAIEELRKADEIYIESYTNLMDEEKVRKLEQKLDKKILRLERVDVEGSFLINKAKNGRIALIASGDPLTATTHVVLLIEAKQKKIPTKVLHNSSIYSAAPARAGLQIYRFGKTATLVNPRENYKPTSSIEVIRENFDRNLHSLVLLDTEPKPMEAKAALELLDGIKEKSAIVLSRVGEEDEKITYDEIEAIKTKPQTEFGKAPFTIIIPAKLHVVEEEYLELFSEKA